jgi:hypothetical protein
MVINSEFDVWCTSILNGCSFVLMMQLLDRAYFCLRERLEILIACWSL